LVPPFFWGNAMRGKKSETSYGNKTIYVRDWERWEKVVELARAQGRSMSDLIAEAMERLLDPPDVAERKLAEIRRILAE
jgi:hypothetical protein